MKRFKFYAWLVPLTLGVASFAACSNDNDGIQNSNNYTRKDSVVDVTSFDQVRYLQNNIIEIDSLGNMVQRVSGVRMNNADSTELTVGAADVNAAAEMFKSWLSPDTKTEATSPSTVDMKADLTDADGKVKETVYFKTAAGNGDNLAEVTFKNGGVLKHFTKVKFVVSSALKQNSHTQYAIGDLDKHDTFEEGEQNWVCVREAKDGVAGLLVYISHRRGSWGEVYNIANFATPSLARAASEAIRSNSSWDTFASYFKEASGQDRLNKGDYYWIDQRTYYVIGCRVYAIRLSDGDPKSFEIVWANPENRFIQVRTFGLVD